MSSNVTYFDMCRQLQRIHPNIDIPSEPTLRWLCSKNGVDFETVREEWVNHYARVKQTLRCLQSSKLAQCLELEMAYGQDLKGKE